MVEGTPPSLGGSDGPPPAENRGQYPGQSPLTSGRGRPYREIPRCLARRQRSGEPRGYSWVLKALTEPRHGVPCPGSQPKPHRGAFSSTQFIISGSLSVAAAKEHASCLVSVIGGPEGWGRALADSTALGPQIRSLLRLLPQAFLGAGGLLLNASHGTAPRKPRWPLPFIGERKRQETLSDTHGAGSEGLQVTCSWSLRGREDAGSPPGGGGS